MKNVLITGASRGIGAETARLFAQNGYSVFINFNKSQQQAETLRASLVGCGYQAEIIRADVSSSSDVGKMFDRIESSCGGIDILVNNAGIAQTKLFTDLSDDDWQQMIASNLSSAFYCCRRALPHMIRQHYGRIVNVASMWGQLGGACEVHYPAAKAGIIGLTKALAMEEGLSGITVNCVSPGVIRTDMTSHLSDEDLNALKNETPTGTLGTPYDVARSILFLAGEDSSFINGQTLGVNGGFVV